MLYSVDTGNPRHPFPFNKTLDLVRLRLTEAPDTITVPSVMYELYTLMFISTIKVL